MIVTVTPNPSIDATLTVDAIVRGEVARAGGRGRRTGCHGGGAEALDAAGLTPVALSAKEGLALINGTQVSTAFALAGLFDGFRAARAAAARRASPSWPDRSRAA